MPASRSWVASPALRYDTICHFTPIKFSISTPATWLGEPTPDVPMVTLSGLALIQATSSFRLFAGMVLRASIRNGCVTASATGSKSVR